MKKTLLVLGISSAVGFSLARKVHTQFEGIIGQYRTESEELNCLKKMMGDKLYLYQSDLSIKEQLESFIEKLKANHIPTHIVYLVAPKYKISKFSKMGWNNFENEIQIQLCPIVNILNWALPQMAKTKSGKVVFMLSSVTSNIPPKYAANYVTTKYAMLGLMKALSSEYVDKKICINGISPSMMDTKFLSELPELVIEQSKASTPFGRLCSVEDVVPMVEFLLSEQSDYITGQNMIINGEG